MKKLDLIRSIVIVCTIGLLGVQSLRVNAQGKGSASSEPEAALYVQAGAMFVAPLLFNAPPSPARQQDVRQWS
ncbi:MAG TPA: hypothetical protein PKM21_19340 [Anaerolineales bacterium]|nr:hypothetical protein [Anaerolineales bacterium]